LEGGGAPGRLVGRLRSRVPEPSEEHLRHGLRLSILSILGTVISSTAAITVGVVDGSLVLIAFGATGLLDAVGSATLIVHFRHALHHEAFSEAHERVALRVVTIGLVVVGVSTASESVRRLITRPTVHASAAGVVLAAASVFVLAALSQRKRATGRLIPSLALVADGWLSGVGALLALTTVVGTGLDLLFGWWWADPVAALAVGAGAVIAAVAMSRG
jgi:divalent metal cation (Fe/Co/Zn/Cd) transporter